MVDMSEQFAHFITKLLGQTETIHGDSLQISEADRKEIVTFIESGSATDVSKFQKLLNRVFTTERQEALLATASTDIKGRKVRYYRYIQYNKFKTLLEKGSLKATDYHVEAPYTEKNRELIKGFLVRYFRSTLKDFDEIYNVYKMTLEDLVYKTFGDTADPETLENIFLSTDTSDWGAILEFIRENVDEVFMKKTHSGGTTAGQVMSDMLSISVGGPVQKSLLKGFVYLELIISDEKVIPYPEVKFQGERELFTREIRIENISRVYATDMAINDEIIRNPHTAVGSFVTDPLRENSRGGRVHVWRWDEPLENNVPLAFYPLYHAHEEAKQAKRKKPLDES